MIDREMSKSINEEIGRLLSDKKWHQFHELLVMVNCIPAEIASRYYVNDAHKTDRVGLISRTTIDQRILRGKKSFLRKRLHDMEQRGIVKSRGLGFEKAVKLL